jgi:hypothetical protein
MYQYKIHTKVNMAIATTMEKYTFSEYTLWFILRIIDNIHKKFYHPPFFSAYGVHLPEKSHLSNVNSIFLRNSDLHSPAVFFSEVSFSDS